MAILQFLGNQLQKFAGVNHSCLFILGPREVAFVPCHYELSMAHEGASDELIVIRIRREANRWDRIMKAAPAANKVEQGRNFIDRKTEPRPTQYGLGIRREFPRRDMALPDPD
jgi:hypothetical protein